MRGEDTVHGLADTLNSGSPPHARGRLAGFDAELGPERITPACAGKTSGCPWRWRASADHPRMRGEDAAWAWVRTCSVGSPPHARGRPTAGRRLSLSGRITPACAGKTSWLGKTQCRRAGSPPHARGRRQNAESIRPDRRITPACAGKTPRARLRRGSTTDHPRMRGEDERIAAARAAWDGSPPHARGRHDFIH